MIRKAIRADVPAIKTLADANRNSVGFVLRATLEENAARGWLLLSEDEADAINGFCNYRHCRNGRTTIYELCVAETARRHGVGRALVETLMLEAERQAQQYIYLKCVVGLPANDFYAKLGFSLVSDEDGRKRRLHLWRLDLQGNVTLWT